MPGHKPRTNKGLAIAAVLMCLACGVSFTQSSASRSPIADTQTPDMFVAGNTDDSQIQSGGAAAENTDAEEENTPEDVIPTETPAADTPAPDTLSGSDTSFEVSPEASQGVWTPVDSNWYFMVNGEGLKAGSQIQTDTAITSMTKVLCRPDGLSLMAIATISMQMEFFRLAT